jgi:hypothetical protein
VAIAAGDDRHEGSERRLTDATGDAGDASGGRDGSGGDEEELELLVDGAEVGEDATGGGQELGLSFAQAGVGLVGDGGEGGALPVTDSCKLGLHADHVARRVELRRRSGGAGVERPEVRDAGGVVFLAGGADLRRHLGSSDFGLGLGLALPAERRQGFDERVQTVHERASVVGG